MDMAGCLLQLQSNCCQIQLQFEVQELLHQNIVQPLQLFLKQGCQGHLQGRCLFLTKRLCLNTFRLVQKVFRRANKYIDETCPWILAKDEQKRGELATVIYNLCECIRTMPLLL